MAKVFAAREILLNLTSWLNGTTDPNVGAGTPGAIGSYWQRNGTNPTTPVETFLKTGAGNFGWTKQNTLHLDVYNVKTFGAIGDGVTNDNAAIQAAIDAAVAAGGGTIYFPPGNYAIYRIPGDLGTFQLFDVTDLTFLGDGYASTIQMLGDAALQTWYAFFLRDDTRRIRFENLRFLGDAFTNPNLAEQHFYINISTTTVGLTHPQDVTMEGCWFDRILKGAASRILGEFDGVPEPVNIRAIRNAYNVGDGTATYARSAFEGQRGAHVQIQHNWMTGSLAQLIDCEPGGGAPFGWSIIGNHLLKENPTGDSIAISGTTTGYLMKETIVAFNTLTSSISSVHGSKNVIRGNIMVIPVDAPSDRAPIYMLNNGERYQEIVGNVFVNAGGSIDRGVIIHAANSITGDQINIQDNLCVTYVVPAAGGGVSIRIERNKHVNVSGNVIWYDTTINNAAVGIQVRAVDVDGDGWLANGNVIIGGGLPLLAGIDFHVENVGHAGNCLANANVTDLAIYGARFTTALGRLFLDGRVCNNNNAIAATTQTIGLPTTNVGATFEGNAGLGAQMTSLALAAGAEGAVTAGAGSLNANQSGTAGTVLQYKESGAAATGWFGVGASEIVFGARALSVATAARFLAPGSALPVEVSTAIALPVARAGLVRGIRVKCTAGVGGGTVSYTVFKNGVSQSGVTIANTDATGTGSISFAIAAGDLVTVQITKSAIPATPQTDVEVTLELTG
jgi:hypothetical protein